MTKEPNSRINLPTQASKGRQTPRTTPTWGELKEGYKTCRGGRRKFPEENTSHLHIQYSAPIKLVALIRKWPLNSDFTVHSSFYHLQKGPDGTSIPRVPLKRIDGGLRCKGRGYIRKETLQKEGIDIFQEKINKCESRELPSKETSTLLINRRSILGPTWGRVYT